MTKPHDLPKCISLQTYLKNFFAVIIKRHKLYWENFISAWVFGYILRMQT